MVHWSTGFLEFGGNMGLVYMMSDPHLDHNNVTLFRTQFKTKEEQTEYIKDRYHSVVTKNDKVFFLGDVCFSKRSLLDLSTWKGTKTLILGNHDTEKLTVNELSTCFSQIHSLITYKGCLLSHAPIHESQLRGKRNIHGHTHSYNLPDDRYLNVSMENIDYTPISLEQIREIFQERMKIQQN